MGGMLLVAERTNMITKSISKSRTWVPGGKVGQRNDDLRLMNVLGHMEHIHTRLIDHRSEHEADSIQGLSDMSIE
jgi:hypothetical protein